ncbi:MAG: tyrosine-type recombinase/integrase [Anaerolineales bacterium]|nr:tyrosine-type recombinase/integrase [Anaerolineales bacterium]
MVTPLSLSRACESMIRYKVATGKSDQTVADYRNSFKKLQLFLPDNPTFAEITREQLVSFFAWLQDSYTSEPDGVAPRGKVRLAPKSILNIHVNLSSLWTWGVNEGLVERNLLRTIEAPRVSEPVVEPFTKEDIAALLKACDQSRTWKTRATTAHDRPSALRDRAIILTLLDTGCRASELVGITVGDLNMSTNSIKVRGKGPGREPKERVVFVGKRAAQALWKYMLPRIEEYRPTDPIFTNDPQSTQPKARTVLTKLLSRIGARAGVKDVYPHRFRHTFAITYLRNEGDLF